MYAPIEPYASGHLDVGDGHLVYWETCGNPNGMPALVIHGGPGSGCTVNQRRNFDPERYRIVLFDQRNCGRSLPHASDVYVDLSCNTTTHLIRDIEALRMMLGVEEWLVWGASWGSVLALAYAERFSDRVSALILIVMGLGRRQEIELMTEGLGALFPAAWLRFREFAERSSVPGSVVDKYHDLLFEPDLLVCSEAARRWCEWESAIVPTAPPSPRLESAEFRLAFARLVTHYWRKGHFLEDDQILRGADRLRGIPGVILQGRLDLWNLSGSPWELAARWPDVDMEFFQSGHEGNEAMSARIVEASDRFAAT
ncbi:MAG: prolyl aminopeptidase [Fimbriimonas sp.]|nr:prolyl aminopeptidase [Fimbriimonas sp.]